MDFFVKCLRYLPAIEAVPYLILFYGASVIRMLKTKSSNDISIFGWTTTLIIQCLYVFYGILIVKEIPYIFACLCATLGTSSVLVTAIYFRNKSKNKK